MIKKTLLLIFATIILSGCDIKYNLDFSEGQIKEILDFNVSDSEVENWIDDDYDFKNAKEYFEGLDFPKYNDGSNDYGYDGMPTKQHDKEIIEKGNFTNVLYSEVYDYEDFYNSYALQKCFDKDNISIINNENGFYIHITGPFHCFYDETIINFSTDYTVLIGNYIEKNKNNYIWKIDEDNHNDIDIEFAVSFKENNYLNVFDFIVLAILLILSIATIIVYKKITKSSV